jgi:hypothetical protein
VPAPAPPEPAPAGRAPDAALEGLGERLSAGIQEQVARRLERALGKLESLPKGGQDADVEEIAARSALLEETIRTRIETALKARGLEDDTT